MTSNLGRGVEESAFTKASMGPLPLPCRRWGFPSMESATSQVTPVSFAAVLKESRTTGERRSRYSLRNASWISEGDNSVPRWSARSLMILPISLCMSFGSCRPYSCSRIYATPPFPDWELIRMMAL